MNLLEELENRESQLVQNISTYGKQFRVKFNIPDNTDIILRDLMQSKLTIEVADLSITVLLSDRLLIHQLGKRVLERKYRKNYIDNATFNDAAAQYQVILTDFHYHFNKERQQFIRNCEDTLAEMDLVLKYYHHPVNGKCIFYGLVSSKFIDSPQTQFRQKLIKALNASGLFTEVNVEKPEMKLINKTSIFSPVRETFSLNDKVSQKFKMTLKVTYGLNNGYRSYSFYFNRQIEIDSMLTPITLGSLNSLVKSLIETQVANSYLAEFRNRNNHRFDFPDYVSIVNKENFLETSTNWRNNPLLHEDGQENDTHNFIENVSMKLLLYTLYFENRIEKAKITKYNPAHLESFFKLFRISNASKNRIKEKIYELDNSMLSLSSAFRFIGTNEKAIATSTKRFLIEIGSKFIDEDNYLSDAVKRGEEVALTGNYDYVDN